MISLDQAIEIAVKAHTGQVDGVGEPYILHPLRVMVNVARYGLDAMICAVLHDVLEDTSNKVNKKTVELKLNELDQIYGLSTIQRNALTALTKFNNETYSSYIKRVKNNSLATRIKIKDLEDNLDVRRFIKIGIQPLVTDRINKYLVALSTLLEC